MSRDSAHPLRESRQSGSSALENSLHQAVVAAVAEVLGEWRGQPPPPDPDQLLTVQQVAEICQVSPSQVRGWLKLALPSITLPGVGRGLRAQRRVRRGDLLAWLQEKPEVQA